VADPVLVENRKSLCDLLRNSDSAHPTSECTC
jgi:hypothetical protein